jgi:hypothetical protein
MKSTASNASNRQVRNPTMPMSRVTHPAGSTGHLSNSSAAAAGGGSAAAAEVSLADQEARQALHETKKAIDHLKSVTGILILLLSYTYLLRFIILHTRVHTLVCKREKKKIQVLLSSVPRSLLSLLQWRRHAVRTSIDT